MKHRRTDVSRFSHVLAGMLLVSVFSSWAPAALATLATCSKPLVGSLALPDVNVAPNTPIGTLLGSLTSVTVVFTCKGTTGHGSFVIQARNLASLDATHNPAGPGIRFKTNRTGIALQLTANPREASSGTIGFDVGVIPDGGGTLSATFTEQFVKTASASTGNLNPITLLKFDWASLEDDQSHDLKAGLKINSSTVVSAATCTVDPGTKNFTVTLPTVSATALASPGATAGRTPFPINLTCQSGGSMSITMATANPDPIVGAVAPSTGAGYAANVGLQLLDSSYNPVTFGKARPLDNSPDGVMAIPYYAQYYRSASAMGAGQVSATVTFRMFYQ